jgi:hypothetical protein
MPVDDEQRSTILSHTNRLISARDFPKTICPSEVARAFSAAELQILNASAWRDTMAIVREIVWELREEGQVEILQKGEVLDGNVGLNDVKGPIRVRATQRG